MRNSGARSAAGEGVALLVIYRLNGLCPSADKGSAGIHVPVKGTLVIQLTRLNGNPIALNSDLIKFVENAPDTVITLINGEKIIVRETPRM